MQARSAIVLALVTACAVDGFRVAKREVDEEAKAELGPGCKLQGGFVARPPNYCASNPGTCAGCSGTWGVFAELEEMVAEEAKAELGPGCKLQGGFVARPPNYCASNPGTCAGCSGTWGVFAELEEMVAEEAKELNEIETADLSASNYGPGRQVGPCNACSSSSGCSGGAYCCPRMKKCIFSQNFCYVRKSQELNEVETADLSASSYGPGQREGPCNACSNNGQCSGGAYCCPRMKKCMFSMNFCYRRSSQAVIAEVGKQFCDQEPESCDEGAELAEGEESFGGCMLKGGFIAYPPNYCANNIGTCLGCAGTWVR